MSAEATVTVYADYVCPFCYLGRTSLNAYRETREAPLAVDWHPYDLRGHKRGPDGAIDHDVEDGKDETYFEQVRENVARLKTEYGADEMLSLDDLPEEVDSLPAQVASEYVRETSPDRWEPFHAAVFEALWVDGRDIGEPSVLAEVAESVGLDGEAVREAAVDEQRREHLFGRFEDARKQGITGVPTFVHDDHAARGAVPPEHLRRLIEGE